MPARPLSKANSEGPGPTMTSPSPSVAPAKAQAHVSSSSSSASSSRSNLFLNLGNSSGSGGGGVGGGSSSTAPPSPAISGGSGSPSTLGSASGSGSLSSPLSPGLSPKEPTRSGRGFCAQAITSVRIKRDRGISFSKKDKSATGNTGAASSGGASSSSSSGNGGVGNGPLSPGLAGPSALAMNRHSPTYASMPGASGMSNSSYSPSPLSAAHPYSSGAGPSSSTGNAHSAASGSAPYGGNDFGSVPASMGVVHAQTVGHGQESKERNFLSRFTHHSSSSSSQPSRSEVGQHAQQHSRSHTHTHRCSHHHHRQSSVDDDDEGAQPEDSFFAHLRTECTDCHEILGSDAVLDGRSPKRRADLALPSDAGSVSGSDVGSHGMEGRADTLRNIAGSASAWVGALGVEPRSFPKGSHLSASYSSTGPQDFKLHANSLDQENGIAHEHEQVLGGFASLGIAPALRSLGGGFASSDWETSSSSASHGARSRSNTGTQSGELGPGSCSGHGNGTTLGSSHAGGIFDGSAVVNDGDDAVTPFVRDVRMSWPSSLKARNADPMETLDILSIEEMGLHSINMGNSDDWEGCIIGPVRADASAASLKFAAAAEFCSASAAISWAVARFVGHPRKWVVAPLQALRPSDDEHLAACTSQRTVVVTDRHQVQSEGASGGSGGGTSMTSMASSHSTPFSESTIFDLRFLRAKPYDAGLIATMGATERADLPTALDHTFVLTTPNMHRSAAKAAAQSAKLAAASRFDVGWTHPFDTASVALSPPSQHSRQSRTQAGRSSASLSVSSSPSTRSASSIVGLGLASHSATSSEGWSQAQSGSVNSEKMSISHMLSGVSSVAMSISNGGGARTSHHEATFSSSLKAADTSVGVPSSYNTTAFNSSGLQTGNHLLRRTRSKPALKQGRQPTGPSLDSPPLATSNANAHIPTPASAVRSPSLVVAPQMQSVGLTGAASPVSSNELGVPSTRRPSLGKAVSYDASAMLPQAGRLPGAAGQPNETARPGHTVGSLPRLPTSIEMLGLDDTPKRCLTMVIPLPLFQLESAPRPVSRYIRITFVPFASSQDHVGEGSSASGEKGASAATGSSSQGREHHHLFNAAHSRHKAVPTSLSQSLALNQMLDNFELPMSPLLTPTAGTPMVATHLAHSQSHSTTSTSTSSQSWYRKIAVAAGARALLHSHDEPGSSLTFSLGGGAHHIGHKDKEKDGSGEGGKDWFKRIGSRHAPDEATHSQTQHTSPIVAGVLASPSTSITNGEGRAKAASHFAHDRCRLPSRRRPIGEAFRVTALVIADPPPSDAAPATHASDLNAPPFGRNISAGAGVGAGSGTFQKGAFTSIAFGGGLGAGTGAIDTNVSPRHQQGEFSSLPRAGEGTASPSLLNEVVAESMQSSSLTTVPSHASDSGTSTSTSSATAATTATTSATILSHVAHQHPLQHQGQPQVHPTSKLVHSNMTPAKVTTTATPQPSSDGSKLQHDWTSDLPEPGTFPVVLAFCDGSRARCLELVPEGWEAIGLGAGAAALGLPGFDGERAGLEGGEGSGGGVPSGALGGVADLILAACAAVMDL